MNAAGFAAAVVGATARRPNLSDHDRAIKLARELVRREARGDEMVNLAREFLREIELAE